MSETQTAPAGNTANQGFMEKHHFLLRRLHSLTGIVPIGVFLLNHLLTNSSMAWGGAALRHPHEGGMAAGGVEYFWDEVKWINEQIPHLLLIEITLWLAIGFHSVLGVYYATTGKSNTDRYAYQGNWRYKLQRISGYVGIFYILYHIATLRWGWSWLIPGGTKWDYLYASSTLAAALQGGMDGWTVKGMLVSAFYFIGVSLLVFHFANGLWTAAITWGVTVSRKAQVRWGVACAGLGTGLMLMAWSSLFAAFLMKPAEVMKVEKALIEKHAEVQPISVEKPSAPGNSSAVGR